MKLRLERGKFLRLWQAAGNVADTKNKNNLLGGVLFSANPDGQIILEATDLKTSAVKCIFKNIEVEEPGTCLLPVEIVSNILKKAKGKTLKLETTSEHAIISSDRNKTRITVMQPEEFPTLPNSDSAEFFCVLQLSDLTKLSAEGTAAGSQPSDFPKYLGTCLLQTTITDIKAVATDGKRISISQALCTSGGENSILIPAAAFKDLTRTLSTYINPLSKITIKTDGTTSWFIIEDEDFEMEFSIRLIETPFPAYEKILNKEVKASMIISRLDFLSAIERIDIIARNNNGHIAVLTLDPESDLKITARAPELGMTTELVKSKIQGEFMRIGFNAMFLQDGLKALGQVSSKDELKIEFSDPEGQTRLYRNDDETFLYMVMPARITSQDYLDDEGEFFAPPEEDINDTPEGDNEPENNSENNNSEEYNEYNEGSQENYNQPENNNEYQN